MLTWGPKAGESTSNGTWMAKLAKDGVPVPRAAVERPVLSPTEQWFWEAYQTLHPSRQNTGFGPGAIPLSEILVYAELMEVPAGESRHELVETIRAMDMAYLAWVSKKHG